MSTKRYPFPIPLHDGTDFRDGPEAIPGIRHNIALVVESICDPDRTPTDMALAMFALAGCFLPKEQEPAASPQDEHPTRGTPAANIKILEALHSGCVPPGPTAAMVIEALGWALPILRMAALAQERIGPSAGNFDGLLSVVRDQLREAARSGKGAKALVWAPSGCTSLADILDVLLKGAS